MKRSTKFAAATALVIVLSSAASPVLATNGTVKPPPENQSNAYSVYFPQWLVDWLN